MKPTEVDMIELKTPRLELPDMSYGYSNEKIKWSQYDPEANREIMRAQYFALTLQCTTWSSSWTAYRVLPTMMGLNKQVNQSLSWAFLEWLGTSYNYLTTLSYTSDFNFDYILLLPPWGVLEVWGQVSRSTENLQVTYTGSVAFLYGADFTINSTTSESFALINKWTTHSKINLSYWDTWAWSPFFSIFMKLYF